MKIFITGASGYIGGSVAAVLREAGHEISGLARSSKRANQLRIEGVTPVLGSLEDSRVLAEAVVNADAVINCANSDHRVSVEVMLQAMEDTDKPFLHTSGTSIVGYPDQGEESDSIFDEEMTFTPSPGRIERVSINEEVVKAANRGIRTVVICPSLIYGEGLGVSKDSMQVPWLLTVADKFGTAKHIGPGGNLWSNVHIQDLTDLYCLALKEAPSGSFYFAENGENSMREVCESINTMMGVNSPPLSMTIAEASVEWGESPANHTMGSNSRVRAKRARLELGWDPKAGSLINEIKYGCYSRH